MHFLSREWFPTVWLVQGRLYCFTVRVLRSQEPASWVMGSFQFQFLVIILHAIRGVSVFLGPSSAQRRVVFASDWFRSWNVCYLMFLAHESWGKNSWDPIICDPILVFLRACAQSHHKMYPGNVSGVHQSEEYLSCWMKNIATYFYNFQRLCFFCLVNKIVCAMDA